ncbi:hypothetical protein [Paracoccus yeei]|uniref:hypothetical protein n=1 Tax=Paracoccus yeei TaxID=147645 RepID=UPI001C8EDF85|nr:hypothetical protein [Paracoccus yeei]MBY0136903.1 hypothetical protein [Paracoccus yeei]
MPRSTLQESGLSFLAPDPNDPDVIIHEVKLTRYDVASRRWRELTAKRAALPPDHDPRKAAALDQQIKTARDAVKRAESDVSRRQESIDEWRSGAGREEYNASRRKVRAKPNADLSSLTPEQQAQQARDRRSDANWLKPRRDAGIPEVQIQAEFAIRIRDREAVRATAATEQDEQAAMEALPGYGLF